MGQNLITRSTGIIRRCSSAIKYQQLRYQSVLLAYLAVSIVVLWLNMNPTYRLYSTSDLALSVVLTAPITVCSLTVSRYCVNFLTVSCILDDTNRDLARRVDRFHRQHASANISAYKLTNSELKLSDHLDRLIIQYDKLYDVVVAIIEIYSPSILFLLVLDFGQVTFQVSIACQPAFELGTGTDCGECVCQIGTRLVPLELPVGC